MICKNCGSAIKENTFFCDNCGMPQDYLIRQVISGDQHAFELLYNYSYQNVYWTIHSMANLDEDTIYDLMQDSYIKAYSALPQLKESVAFNGWMKRIAQNETLDYLRKSSKNSVIFLSDLTSDGSDVKEYDVRDESAKSNPEVSMEYQDRSRLLNEILDSIPEEQRVVLSMYYMQEMSIKEIAEELGIGENTVKSRMSYGRKKVEKIVLDLEKKGVNLLGLTAMGFFTWLLTGISADAAEKIPDSVLQGAQQGILHVASSSASAGERLAGKKAAAESVGKMVAGEAGKEAVRTVGKTGVARIIVGVLAIAVAGIGTGVVIYNATTGDGNPGQTEIVYEKETQSHETEIITEEETESEFEAETETETETESETELTVSLTDDEVIMDTIHALGYEYIGGQSYEVLYQGGYAYTDNAGMQQEPPVGVASYAVADLDGDGEDELLLVILEPTERLHDTSGSQDSRLAFTVCEDRNGTWEESQSISQISDYHEGYLSNIMSIADFLPCVSIYLAPSGDGMHILIDNPLYGSFSADIFDETMEIVYREDGMSGIQYGAWSDRAEGENEAIAAINEEMQSEGSTLISKIYLPEFYPDGVNMDYDFLSQLYSGQDTSATLVINDFRNSEGYIKNDDRGSETETETAVVSPEDDENETSDNKTGGTDEGGLKIVYLEPETEEETESGTVQTASITSDAAISDTIQNLGYEYIGGNSYDVLYQGGYARTDNAGMEQEPPVGVASYVLTDMDGDGEEELLLVILEPTERVYDTSGKQDSRLAFSVCENRNGVWEETQHISQVTCFGRDYQVNIMSIADVLPCISTYLVPSENGMKIVIENPFYGSFASDHFSEIIEIVYSEEGMTGVNYGGESEPVEGEREITDVLYQDMHSDNSTLISKIYLPEFYPDGSNMDVYGLYSQLIQGQDTETTLVLEDIGRENNINENENEYESDKSDEDYEKSTYEQAVAYYQNGDREKAQEYFDMLPEDAEEDCVKNIPEEIEKAYLEIIDAYPKYNDVDIDNMEKFMWNYFLTDIDKDGIAELIVEYGPPAANGPDAIVYTWKDDNIEEAGSFYCGGSSQFYYDPRGNGMIMGSFHQFLEKITTVKLIDGKLVLEEWSDMIDLTNGFTTAADLSSYMRLPYLLESYQPYEQVDEAEISEEAKAAYQVILDEYIAAFNDNNFSTEYYFSDNNPFPDVSAVIMSFAHSKRSFYYTFYDIDGNGQCEMILGSAYEHDMEYLSLVDIYTFNGERAVKFSDDTYSVGDRSQLYIYENGAIIIRDSWGAANGDYRFMKIDADGYTVTLDKEYIYSPNEEMDTFVYSSDSDTLSGEEFGAFYSEYVEEDIDIQLNESGYFYSDSEGLKFNSWTEFIDSMDE